MQYQIGISTALCPWDPSAVFELAHYFDDIGVELLPFKWHGVKFIEEMNVSYPRAKLFGRTCSVFRTQ